MLDTTALQELSDWLIDGAKSAASPADALRMSCERLVNAGMPLWRVGVFVRTLHPDIFGRNFIWKQGAGVEIGSVDFAILDSPDFHSSPLSIVFTQAQEVRARTDGPAGDRFPIVAEMRAEGVTDYIALPVPFTDGTVNASSWTTKQPGGFTDAQLTALRAVIRPLARYVEIVDLRRRAATLLDTYVGNRAGAKILGGQIRRGHNETMNAAIWLSDLRGFTSLSDRLPAETVVDILNRYFDCQVAAIRDHGGEVLKYMGDGLLAVFPVDEYVGDEQQVCSRVLQAARESRASVEALQYPVNGGIERFRFGVALHLGRILYGNIGGGNRLDFTCIGPAINLAARLEKLTGKLKRTVVASEGFAGICPGGWSDLGEFPVAGFSRSARVFGLVDEDATAAA